MPREWNETKTSFLLSPPLKWCQGVQAWIPKERVRKVERVVILDSDSDSETDSCEFVFRQTDRPASGSIVRDNFHDTDS